jgi:hypothetical protein
MKSKVNTSTSIPTCINQMVWTPKKYIYKLIRGPF